MKILVGLTHECPTGEHIEVYPIKEYPMNALDPEMPTGEARIPIRSDEDLKEWAYRYFEIHAIREV